MLTGNFFSPNLERQKSRPTASPVIVKDPINSYQQRLQRFATAEGESAHAVDPSNKENGGLLANKNEFWTGSPTLKVGSSSARARNIHSKPLSPQLDKKYQDKPIFKDNLGLILTSDQSYLKRVKEVLQERTQSKDKHQEIFPAPTAAEEVSLRRLKEITSGKNLFINSNLFTNQDGRVKGRAPLTEQDLNLNRSGSNKDADTSSLSNNTKEKSTISQKPVPQSPSKNPPSPLSLFQNKLAEQMEENHNLLDSRHSEMIEAVPEQVKPSRIRLLAQTEETVYTIYQQITQDKDPYESIRFYSDHAQDSQFNLLENMFKSKNAKMQFARLLKIERWLIVYLFYFTVQDNNYEKNKIHMIELSDLLYKNMSFIVSWVCRLSENAGKNLDIYFKNVSVQVSIAQFRPNTFFDAAQNNIKTILAKLTTISKDLNKNCQGILAKFSDAMDRWSLNKCFEKGFECFYDTFIQKGVISVSYQDKENQPGTKVAAATQEKNTNQQAKEEVSNVADKETPKKESSFKNVEELPTERKSFGDKLIIQELRDCNGFHKHVDKIDSPFFLFQPDTHKVKQKKALIPPIKADREYTLVLDLDETLIHYEENADGTSQFLIRPFAQNFLKEVSKYYEVIIFTAALKDYADFILDRLDTEGVISHRLYRQNCSFSENVYQKDLNKLGRDLSRTLIVDNNAENFQQQPDNGIYIRSWYNDPNDEALKKLAPLLIGNPFVNFRHRQKAIFRCENSFEEVQRNDVEETERGETSLDQLYSVYRTSSWKQ